MPTPASKNTGDFKKNLKIKPSWSREFKILSRHGHKNSRNLGLHGQIRLENPIIRVNTGDFHRIRVIYDVDRVKGLRYW